MDLARFAGGSVGYSFIDLITTFFRSHSALVPLVAILSVLLALGAYKFIKDWLPW